MEGFEQTFSFVVENCCSREHRCPHATVIAAAFSAGDCASSLLVRFGVEGKGCRAGTCAVLKGLAQALLVIEPDEKHSRDISECTQRTRSFVLLLLDRVSFHRE